MRHERRERRDGEKPIHDTMRQPLVSVGDDFWIETDSGERAFEVDGKALRLRTTLVLEDAHATRSRRSRSG